MKSFFPTGPEIRPLTKKGGLLGTWPTFCLCCFTTYIQQITSLWQYRGCNMPSEVATHKIWQLWTFSHCSVPEHHVPEFLTKSVFEYSQNLTEMEVSLVEAMWKLKSLLFTYQSYLFIFNIFNTLAMAGHKYKK